MTNRKSRLQEAIEYLEEREKRRDRTGGIFIPAERSDEARTIDIKDLHLMDCPMVDKSFCQYILRDHSHSEEDLIEPPMTYYPNLELVLASGGDSHKVAEAYLNRDTAYAKVYVMDDMESLNNIITDGIRWTEKETGLDKGEVYNFKAALLFTFKQIELGIISPDDIKISKGERHGTKQEQ